jgi:hypothetical protein
MVSTRFEAELVHNLRSALGELAEPVLRVSTVGDAFGPLCPIDRQEGRV